MNFLDNFHQFPFPVISDQNVNIEKLITDLMQQLKEMEYTYGETQSPRSEIEQAEKQIRTVSLNSR